jgi:hypothetical protein
MNYRILTDCNSEPLTKVYGGPLWVHNFDYYVEYSFPHLKSITLMQGDHEYTHPNVKIGFNLENARVGPGRYYDVYHERITTL